MFEVRQAISHGRTRPGRARRAPAARCCVLSGKRCGYGLVKTPSFELLPGAVAYAVPRAPEAHGIACEDPD